MTKEERLKAAEAYAQKLDKFTNLDTHAFSNRDINDIVSYTANKAFLAGAEAEAESNKTVFEDLRKHLVSKMPYFSGFEKLGTKKHSEWIGFSNAITALDNFLLNKY